MPEFTEGFPLEDDPLWYKDAIIYEVHVRAFFDSNDDGIGDFRGLTQKLDYLQDLGVTAIWLLPFYPSPLKDDGYDIADYSNVHPSYGTLRDFKAFSARGASARPAGHHRTGAEPHFGPASVVSACAPREARAATARFSTSGATRRKIQRRADHLQGFRNVELDVGPAGQGLFLASLLFAISPI